jgi:hypothetical protein
MNRPILVCALFLAATAVLGAQNASQSDPYQGTSNPPADDTIVTSTEEQAKPPAGQPANAQPAPPVPAQAQPEPQPTSVDPSLNYPNPGTDDGIVQAARPAPQQQVLTARAYAPDPDGDIVHPRPLRRGEIGEGTTIRVRLLDRLSTTNSEKGEPFRSRVASSVYRDGRVLIPAGAEIDGRVVQVSSGHAGGHGSMRLRPETVILPNGTHYRLHAEITGTPGSRTRVGGENTIVPDSRLKRDGLEYGGAVGGGAVTGAILGGPVGALTGSLIGAGLVTVHLLASHPQATLDPGSALLFTLTEPLELVPSSESNN